MKDIKLPKGTLHFLFSAIWHIFTLYFSVFSFFLLHSKQHSINFSDYYLFMMLTRFKSKYSKTTFFFWYVHLMRHLAHNSYTWCYWGWFSHIAHTSGRDKNIINLLCDKISWGCAFPPSTLNTLNRHSWLKKSPPFSHPTHRLSFRMWHS